MMTGNHVEADLKIDLLVAEYRDLIHEAIMECELDLSVNRASAKLDSKLKVIYKAASYEGIQETVITELIAEVMPMNRLPKVA